MINISIIETFYEGFRLGARNYFLILVGTILYIVSSILFGITIIGILALPAFLGGYYHFLICVAKGKLPKLGSIYSKGFQNFGSLLFASIISCLGIVLGLILFLIPGIYLIIVWSFIMYLIVDQNINVREAFSRSRSLIHSVGWWKTAGVLGLTHLIYIMFEVFAYIPSIGIYIYLIGPLMIYPLISMVYVVYYLKVIKLHDNPDLSD
jgi:hypothetical protein